MPKLVLNFVDLPLKEKNFAERMEESVERAAEFYGTNVVSVSLTPLPVDGISQVDDKDVKIMVGATEQAFDNDLRHGQYETVLGLRNCAFEGGYDLIACELA